MYIKHVFSWLLCYHGMHIVQKVRSTLKHISTSKQCQRLLFAVYNKYNVKNLEYKNLYVPGMGK